MEQKENSSLASKVSSSSDRKSNYSSSSSHIINCTHAKLTQQAVNYLAKGLGNIPITKYTALSMQDIAEWCLVGGEDSNYNNPITFKGVWYYEDKDKHMKWHEAINKEIADMTNCKVWKRQRMIHFQLIKD